MRLGISVRDLSYSYGKDEIIKGIHVHVEKETLTALLGPNGSGKSTFLKLISNYLRPQAGDIRVLGKKVADLEPKERSLLLAFAGDEPLPAFSYTVRETVLMGRIGRGKHSIKDMEDSMASLSLLGKEERAVDSLSSGERQRVFLARSLYQDAKVLLLDEPTNHLDMAYETKVMELAERQVTSKGKTVLLVLHDINLALRYASRILFMKDGEIVANLRSQEVTPEILETVYGVKVTIIEHEGSKRIVVVD